MYKGGLWKRAQIWYTVRVASSVLQKWGALDMKKENLGKYRWTPALLEAIAFLSDYIHMHVAVTVALIVLGVAAAIYAFKYIPKFYSIVAFALAALLVIGMVF
jgi:hypothetical protein